MNAKPTLDGARTVEVEPVPNDRELRYERWVADNIAAVDKASNGQLGYMHLTAMGDQNIGQFDKYWRAFRYPGTASDGRYVFPPTSRTAATVRPSSST